MVTEDLQADESDLICTAYKHWGVLGLELDAPKAAEICLQEHLKKTRKARLLCGFVCVRPAQLVVMKVLFGRRHQLDFRTFTH